MGVQSAVEVANSVNVYPNPATDEITIEVGGECNNCKIEIISTLGSTVKSMAVSSEINKASVSDLMNGVYFIKITKANKMVSLQKLIIQR